MKSKRRDPLFTLGILIVLLLGFMVSVLARMFVFLRFVSALLLLCVLVFAAVICFRVYVRDRLR